MSSELPLIVILTERAAQMRVRRLELDLEMGVVADQLYEQVLTRHSKKVDQALGEGRRGGPGGGFPRQEEAS